MEIDGGSSEKWNTVRNYKRKKKVKDKSEDSGSENRLVGRTKEEEYKVFVKLVHEGDSFGSVNPI